MGCPLRRLHLHPHRVSTSSTYSHLTSHPEKHRLKRIYVLFHALHGLNQDDKAMLADLDARCQSSEGQQFTLQAVVTKLDRLLMSKDRDGDGPAWLKRIRADIFESAPTCLPPILTSTRHPWTVGIDELRKNIAEACAVR